MKFLLVSFSQLDTSQGCFSTEEMLWSDWSAGKCMETFSRLVVDRSRPSSPWTSGPCIRKQIEQDREREKQ